MTGVRLTKHHGLGNDFLILVDLDGEHELTPERARAVCHRRTGIGADGLIRVGRGDDGTLAMELLNADGSVAEMSGNGIRCFAQAALAVGALDPSAAEVPVLTGGGLRHVRVVGGDVGARLDVAVDMGPARPDRPPAGWQTWAPGVERAASIDLGNPHLVLDVDPADVDLVAIGTAANSALPAGVNVEAVVVDEPPPGHDGGPAGASLVRMEVFERGVGTTEACGTGACAAAAAMHDWGLVGPRVTVAMPGGSVSVDLGARVTLTGPTVFIGEVSLPRW